MVIQSRKLESILLLIFLMGSLSYAMGQSGSTTHAGVDSAKMSIEADDTISITLYFRWDKDNIDSAYLTNAQTLHRIDSIMRLKRAAYIDTLRITAFASPEGSPGYNQKH